jgi:polyvinyl alcohol dehydrogenase (cytochrome)
LWLRWVRRRWGWLAVLALAVVLVAVPEGSALSTASAAANWPGYLFSPAHSSYNPLALALTPRTVQDLTPAWKFIPDPPPIKSLGGFYSSPTVYDGVIYIGARNGIFYALKESNGKLLWKRSFGIRPAIKCGPEGFTSTATVAPDPKTGKPTVYTTPADGYLHALDAATGKDIWTPAPIGVPSRTADDYYAWSSPLLYDGHLYVGISSQCDEPLVQAGLREVDQETGAVENTYWTLPQGNLGGSIWSSAAANGSQLWVTTGNGGAKVDGDGYSIVRLDAQTLAKQDIWTVPVAQRVSDSDFGASPTLFTANLGGTETQMVGACNKNGVYYALKAQQLSAGPVWTLHLGAAASPTAGQCDAASIWDGSHLYVASNNTTIKGAPAAGSIQELDPATGAPVWQDALTAPVTGTPTMDGGGVIAAITYGVKRANTLYLIEASTGKILRELPLGPSANFAQPVFADNWLFIATREFGLRAYQVVIKPGPAPVTTHTFRVSLHNAKPPTKCSSGTTRDRILTMLGGFNTGRGYTFELGFAGNFLFKPYPGSGLAPANGFGHGKRLAIGVFVHNRFLASDGWTATSLDLERVTSHPKVAVYRLGLQVRFQGALLQRSAQVGIGCFTGHVRTWLGPTIGH